MSDASKQLRDKAARSLRAARESVAREDREKLRLMANGYKALAREQAWLDGEWKKYPRETFPHRESHI